MQRKLFHFLFIELKGDNCNAKDIKNATEKTIYECIVNIDLIIGRFILYVF